MKHRKLRIVWSVAWGSTAMLLVVLWVRSYIKPSDFNLLGYYCHPMRGVIMAMKGFPTASNSDVYKVGYSLEEAARVRPLPRGVKFEPLKGNLGFAWRYDVGLLWYVQVPYWFLCAVVGALAAAPFLQAFHLRFSLHTLLVGTTLISVGLGIIVWLTR
jgi:hypothetical protein